MIDPADGALGAWRGEVFAWDLGRRDQVAVTCQTIAYGEHRDQVVDVWRPRAEPVAPVGFQWRQALGAYDRLPEWIGYFARAIDDEGWAAVVQTWVPRLMPAGAVRSPRPLPGRRGYPHFHSPAYPQPCRILSSVVIQILHRLMHSCYPGRPRRYGEHEPRENFVIPV